MASPTQHAGKIPSHGTGEMGQPFTAERDAAQADVLVAVQQITQMPPSPSCATSGSISLIDSDGTSIDDIQGKSPSTMIKKRLVGSDKPVSRSVNNSTQGLRRTLPHQVHSPSPAWSYHSSWSDDLSPTAHHTTFST